MAIRKNEKVEVYKEAYDSYGCIYVIEHKTYEVWGLGHDEHNPYPNGSEYRLLQHRPIGHEKPYQVSELVPFGTPKAVMDKLMELLDVR